MVSRLVLFLLSCLSAITPFLPPPPSFIATDIDTQCVMGGKLTPGITLQPLRPHTRLNLTEILCLLAARRFAGAHGD